MTDILFCKSAEASVSMTDHSMTEDWESCGMGGDHHQRLESNQQVVGKMEVDFTEKL